MPKYGRASKAQLATCTEGIQRVFNKVIEIIDVSAMEGKRTEDRQAHLVKIGSSTTMQSKHVPRKPNGVYDPEGKSSAVDSAPYPIRWPKDAVLKRVLDKIDNDAELKEYIKDVARFYALGGVVRAIAHTEGVPMRWGGDWDGDWDFSDQTFDDLVHFEEK